MKKNTLKKRTVMGKSSIIEKTSNEEGKYAEHIARFCYENWKALGGNPSYHDCIVEDVSNDKDYQKKDIDIVLTRKNGKKTTIEVKNDTWVFASRKKYPDGTGNIPYEFATHVPKSIKEWCKGREKTNLKEIYENFPDLKKFHIGCNEKSEAEQEFLVATQEEYPNNRRYKLKSILTINHKKLKDLANTIDFYTQPSFGNYWFKEKFQEEDKGYNYMIIMPIKSLDEKEYFQQMPDEMLSRLFEMIPELNEFHTSDEIGKIIFGN